METKYHYYGFVVSEYEIGGKPLVLHPGQEVMLPEDDERVKRLIAQNLLVPVQIEFKKILASSDIGETQKTQEEKSDISVQKSIKKEGGKQ